ncbi:MAG: transposase [Caldilineaceae bacterium]|nr:transposase [Caldilineaceae bacterium]
MQCKRHIDQESGYGRFEYRALESATALNQYLHWPGDKRMPRRTRRHPHQRAGSSSLHVRYSISSLGPDLRPIDQVEQLWRWHWTIENGNHYRRDVSFGEDRCRSHALDSAQARVARRNAMLGLTRLEGWHSILDAFRSFRHSSQHPLRFYGAIPS